MVNNDSVRTVPWWQPVLFAAMAGGLGWGIRGQYGHETGAMIAGVLVSLTLVYLLCPGNSSLQVVRAVALATIAMGFGGTMTYGQTVGLTQDTPLVGHWDAFRWGMLGLAIKGGIWIGFAGFFLGMGLGGKRYRPFEMLKLVFIMMGAVALGWSLLNHPHDPANMRLPYFYFSDHWYWEPDIVGKVKHRPEVWGGLLFALVASITYAAVVKRDKLGRNMALWGSLGGALGFPLGQCVQASNAWNPGYYSQTILAPFTNYLNWWNTMETTFGTIMGAVLGLGLWFNRARIDLTPDPDDKPMPYWGEGALLAAHLAFLSAVQFTEWPWADALYDFGIMMGLIPLVACIRGRIWPYMQILPITLLPIAGKTLKAIMIPGDGSIAPGLGWPIFFLVPIAAATALAIPATLSMARGIEQRSFIRNALLLTTWTYFGLNHAFFGFPWPWLAWGGRTANGLIFTIYALGLTALALSPPRRAAQRRS